jgi:sugar phosphate isomerase/epimerase
VKVGVMTVAYYPRPLAKLLPELAELGVEAVELGTGNYPGDLHCPPDTLLGNKAAQADLLSLVARHGMTISALSQQGNPLHPRRELARHAHETWRKSVELAAQLGVPVVNAFSGCPGDSETSLHPNWVTYPWPPEYLDLLAWQWNEKVIPYWVDEARFAASRGIKVAIEMHPGFVVYNPTTLLKLRQAAGESIGANFDPSHLFWQGIDPIEAVEKLAAEEMIFHVHAKDTELRDAGIREKGVLDLDPLESFETRSWSFRTVGFGHDEELWRRLLGALVDGGYDYVVSVEHEDEGADTAGAIAASIRLLRELLGRPEPQIVSVGTDEEPVPRESEPLARVQALLPEGGTE